jgi:hypothetical protein
MKTPHVIALSMFVGAALGAIAVQSLHAEDTYKRNLPLDTTSAPILPPGSTLDLQPTRPRDADQISPATKDSAPSIGLSIKAPVDDRK